jgi:hypothetical protein
MSPYLATLSSRVLVKSQDVSLKMSFSETGITCIYLSVLNVKLAPRGAKIKNLKAFFCIFCFHGLPPVNLSNTYFQGLRGKATISYGIDFFVL